MSLHTAHYLLPGSLLSSFCPRPMWDPLGREVVNCLRGRKELGLGPLCARDTDMLLWVTHSAFVGLGSFNWVLWEEVGNTVW